MRTLTILVLVLACMPAPALACGPVDVMTSVGSTGDGFVLVVGGRVMRIAPPDRVERTFELREHGQHAALLSDGRTLLNLVPTGGETPDCVPNRLRFELVDTMEETRPRTLGTFPRGGGGINVESITQREDGATVVRYMVERRGDLEEVTISAGARRATARVIPGRGQLPSEYELARESGIAALVPVGTQDQVRVRDASGALLVTVMTNSAPVRGALTRDGRYLAIVTFSAESDYGTGLDARVDVIDLRSGARTTPHGTGTAVTGVRGRLTLACRDVVDDPSSPLNVRETPNARGRVVGTIPHETPITIEETNGSWRRLSAPLAGWVWGANTRRACTAVP